MTSRRVAILGGGNGARAAAVEFGLRGHDVVLYPSVRRPGAAADIEQAGGITAHGVIEGTAPVTVAADMAAAVDGADVVMMVVPTVHQVAFADVLAPHLRDGLALALMPGSLGSLELVHRLREAGVRADFTVSEIAALPYITRITGPAEVAVHGRRRYTAAGVFPAAASGAVIPLLQDLYPELRPLANVLEAGLSNPNPTLHCLGVLLSASRIEYSGGEFYYYAEGMTPHVCQAIEAIDAERLSIGRALGIELLSLADTFPEMGYAPAGENFHEVIRAVVPLRGIRGPSELDNRYLTEDVPIGLTIYSQLGRQLGVATPLMESVIALTGALLGRDFVAEGRTLGRCGIEGLTGEELLHYVTRGDGV